HQPALLAAAESFYRARIIFRNETETVENMLDPMIHVVSIMVAEQLIKSIITGSQRFVLRLVGRAGQGLRRAHHIVMGCHQLIQRTASIFKKLTAGLKLRLLLEQRRPS